MQLALRTKRAAVAVLLVACLASAGVPANDRLGPAKKAYHALITRAKAIKAPAQTPGTPVVAFASDKAIKSHAQQDSASTQGSMHLVASPAPAPVTCGPAGEQPHAKPKNYEDARADKYDAATKTTVANEFYAGAVIDYECKPGFTTDGSNGGNTFFNVNCTEHGYYAPEAVCMEESKCGAYPTIDHARPTGKTKNGRVEFACDNGYSLDGEKVVAGGFGKNRFFELKCIEFSAAFEKFEGRCQAYQFVPAKESIRIYNQVFEALFVVTCEGELKKQFADNGTDTPQVDTVCAEFEDAGVAGSCAGLVSTIITDFTNEKSARQTFDDTTGANREWYEAHDSARPGIEDEAHTFCTELWKLLEIPPNPPGAVATTGGFLQKQI